MKRTRKYSYHTVTLIAIVFSAVVPVIVIGWILLAEFNNTLIANAADVCQQTADQLQNRMRQWVESRLTKIMQTDAFLSSGQTQRAQAEMKLNTIVEDDNAYYCIRVGDSAGNMIDYFSCERLVLNTEGVPNGLRAQNRYGDYAISKPHLLEMFQNQSERVITFSGTLGDSCCYGKETVLFLDVRLSAIAEMIDPVYIGESGYCFLSGGGDILYRPKREDRSAQDFDRDRTEVLQRTDGGGRDEKRIYIKRRIPGTDWTVVGIGYLDDAIAANIQKGMILTFVTVCGGALTCALAGLVMSKLLLGPIDRLIRGMAEFEKDAEQFRYRGIGGGCVEVRELSYSFAHMVRKIQRLMKKIQREEREIRRSEFRTLQAQIRPHFLYNTLDSVLWMCESGKTQQAASMISALSKLFRIGISGGKDKIRLSEEIEHVKSYLLIQSIRYGERFDYQVEIAPEICDAECLKTILQPFAENALCHGIDGTSGEGRIRIKGYEKKGDVILQIVDNGRGMKRDRIEEIFSGKTLKNTQGGMGIKNVNDRLQLCYGSGYGVEIESEEGEGTTVTIRFPYEKNDVQTVKTATDLVCEDR